MLGEGAKPITTRHLGAEERRMGVLHGLDRIGGDEYHLDVGLVPVLLLSLSVRFDRHVGVGEFAQIDERAPGGVEDDQEVGQFRSHEGQPSRSARSCSPVLFNRSMTRSSRSAGSGWPRSAHAAASPRSHRVGGPPRPPPPGEDSRAVLPRAFPRASPTRVEARYEAESPRDGRVSTRRCESRDIRRSLAGRRNALSACRAMRSPGTTARSRPAGWA